MTYDLVAVASDIKPSEEVTHLTLTLRNQVGEDEMFQTEETTSKITSSFGYWVLCIPTICHMAHSFKALVTTNNWNLLEILMPEFFSCTY